jgi:hypothetical protein
MTYYETLAGGGVFVMDIINWYRSPVSDDYENDVASMTGNALMRFIRRNRDRGKDPSRQGTINRTPPLV